MNYWESEAHVARYCCSELRIQIEELKGRANHEKARADAAEKRVVKIGWRNDWQTKRILSLQDERQGLKAEVCHFQACTTEWKNEVTELTKERDDLRRNAAAHITDESLIEDNAYLKSHTNTLHKSISNLQQYLAVSEASRKKAIREAVKNLESARVTSAQAVSECTDRAVTIIQLQGDITVLNKERGAALMELKRVKADFWGDEVAGLKAQLKRSENNKEYLLHQNERLKAQVKRKQQRLYSVKAELNTERSTAQKKAASDARTIDNLRYSLDQAEDNHPCVTSTKGL